MTEETVAVIIPCFKSQEYCALAAYSAALNTPNATIILVDDGETVDIGYITKGIERFIVQQYKRTEKSLTRSWNAGLMIARKIEATYTVCGNSDLLFEKNWFDKIPKALSSREFDFAGPVTNACGHVKRQHWSIDSQETYEPTNRLNGFCFVGKTLRYFDFSINPYEVFNSIYPLAGNEDDFFKRAQKDGAKLCISRKSRVKHFRGKSRGLVGPHDGACDMSSDEKKILEEREDFKHHDCIHIGKVIERKGSCASCFIYECEKYSTTIPNQPTELGGCLGCKSYES